MHSLKTILPINIQFQSPSLLKEPFHQKEMAVLVGLLGDFRGRVIIDSTSSTFSQIAHMMCGMEVEGEMLESFTGEFGNMFAGNLSTHVGSNEINLDITPPTVIVGNSKLFGFKKAFQLPTIVENIGQLTILFTIDEEQ